MNINYYIIDEEKFNISDTYNIHICYMFIKSNFNSIILSGSLNPRVLNQSEPGWVTFTAVGWSKNLI